MANKDQNYIHTKLQSDKYSNLKVHKLDRDNFPNGYRWYKWHKKLNPSIVHYISIDSIEGKIQKMKQFNHWLDEKYLKFLYAATNISTGLKT